MQPQVLMKLSKILYCLDLGVMIHNRENTVCLKKLHITVKKSLVLHVMND